MVNAEKLITYAASELKESGIENSLFEAGLIIEKHLGIKRFDIHFKETPVSDKVLFDIKNDINRRKKHEPLQYILGTWEFMSLDFKVRSGVLIPRPDSETLVESVLSIVKHNNFTDCADLCTGSGCIGISVCHYSKNVFVDAFDVSDDALTVANENAGIHNCSHFKTHHLDVLKQATGSYDIIFSNPPYIETEIIDTLDREVKEYEPHLALDGGYDGLLFYKTVIPLWKKSLKSGGYMCFECGINQADKIADIFLQSGYTKLEIHKDLNKIDRVITARLL